MTKGAKDVNKPKKALSGYLCYCNAKRSTVSTLKFAEQTKTLSSQWNSMSDADKAPYMEMALKDKERYTNAMKTYVAPVVNTEVKGKGKSKANVDANGEAVVKEKKKPSGYILFGADARVALKKENPSLKAPEVMKEVGNRWKALSDKQRAEYNEKAKA